MTKFIETDRGVFLNVNNLVMIYPMQQGEKFICCATMQGQDPEEYIIVKENFNTKEDVNNFINGII
jgi:hypothetical protein